VAVGTMWGEERSVPLSVPVPSVLSLLVPNGKSGGGGGREVPCLYCLYSISLSQASLPAAHEKRTK
jgi:hypothetical protein